MAAAPQYFGISRRFEFHPDGKWRTGGREGMETMRTDSLQEAVAWVRERAMIGLGVSLSGDGQLIIRKPPGETGLRNMLAPPEVYPDAPELDELNI